MGSFRLIRAGSREGPPRREVISCPTYSGLAEPASNFPDKSRKASGTKLWEKTRIILPIVVNREVIGLEKFPSLLLLVFEAFRGNRCFKFSTRRNETNNYYKPGRDQRFSGRGVIRNMPCSVEREVVSPHELLSQLTNLCRYCFRVANWDEISG